MTLKKIILTPSASIILTRTELEAIVACAASHYDWTCKAEARHGGRIMGWLNWVSEENQTIEVTVNFDTVDLICKILECSEHVMLRNGFVCLIKIFNQRYMTEEIK